MSIITSGEAGGSLSSGNNNTCNGASGRELDNNQEFVVEKQEGILQLHDHQINFHGSINSLSSTTTLSNGSTTQSPQLANNKKKRNPPGNPDPSADVIALSPNTLLAKNRFVCEICSKGFQRDQNLQLHRRGHNLPWKLRQRNANEVVRKRVYICPEVSCVHHNPARALGDLTGIKKHFSRKHGEKKWKCERCNKKYAVQSDWKAHSKTCGTREYKCECGTIFSRRDSFITHRAFCDAIAEENSKTTLVGPISSMERHPNHDQISNRSELISSLIMHNTPINTMQATATNDNNNNLINDNKPDHQALITNNTNTTTNSASAINHNRPISNNNVTYQSAAACHYMSATALLQKAAQMGSTVGDASVMAPPSYHQNHHHHYHHHHQGLVNVNSNSNNNNNNVGFFGGLLYGTHQSHAGNSGNNDVVLHGSVVRGNSSGGGGGDVMTVDFLGINGRSDHHLGKFVDQHKQQALNSNNEINNNGIISNSTNKQLGDTSDHQVDLRFNGEISNLHGLSQFEQHVGMIGKHVWEI